MRDPDEDELVGVALGALLGFGLGRISSVSRRPGPVSTANPFRRLPGFQIATKVSISQLADGNWDIDPYRLQLPKAGTPVTVTWALDAATIAEGFAFDPAKGVTVQKGGAEFSNPRLNPNGSFSVDAENKTPEAEYKYGVALLKHGLLHFTIDPPIRNGPWG